MADAKTDPLERIADALEALVSIERERDARRKRGRAPEPEPVPKIVVRPETREAARLALARAGLVGPKRGR